MTEYQLVDRWKVETDWSVSNIKMSGDGHYLLTKGDDRIAYYSWGSQPLWEGLVRGELRHVVVSSDRKQTIAVSEDKIYAFNREGKLLWTGFTEWKVQALHLNSNTHCIAASDGYRVSSLNEQGQPIWKHDLRKAVCSVAVSPTDRLSTERE